MAFSAQVFKILDFFTKISVHSKKITIALRYWFVESLSKESTETGIPSEEKTLFLFGKAKQAVVRHIDKNILVFVLLASRIFLLGR